MNNPSIFRLLLAGLLAWLAPQLRAADESALIARLQSGAGVADKCAACQQLRMSGTARAVPALASLLREEQTSHAARYALEAIPGPAAGSALLEAFGKTSGAIRIGLMDSLGWRREAAAVPLLIPLLAEADATLASAAAAALGRIGGPEAAAALAAARGQAPPKVQPSVLEALLQCAERLLAEGDRPGAAALYQPLNNAQVPLHIRAGAWRGLVLADASRRVRMLTRALASADRPMHKAALKLVRQLGDEAVLRACREQWTGWPVAAQLAVLDAHLAPGAEALPLVRTASTSPEIAMRIAAWQAMANLNDASFIPALAQAAALGEASEREAARGALARIHGSGVREALLARISVAEPPEKAELLLALGERGDAGAAPVLLEHAGAGTPAVCLAALESLRKLAMPDTLAPLLGLAAKSSAEAPREAALKALFAVCQASPDKNRTSQQVIEALDRFAPPERQQALPLLADLATPGALDAALASARSQDLELAREAVRVLAQWPNAAPAKPLLELARSSADPTLKTLSLRGAIEVAGQEPDSARRLALLQQAMGEAKTSEQKKQVLGQIGQVPQGEALQLALISLADPALVNEAGLAAISIAEKLAPANPVLGDEVAVKVLDKCQAADIVKRAWALRLKPKGSGPWIQDWLVCGPFRQADLVGAQAVFNLVAGPEKPGTKVDWKVVPRTDQVSLAVLFPNQDNCVAYLKTCLIAPADCEAVLLLASDDGIKAWLNGTVVHSNNVDRGAVADQDMAPVKLRQGPNELLLKISQGGGGWEACARLVGADGKPIPGLRVQSP